MGRLAAETQMATTSFPAPELPPHPRAGGGHLVDSLYGSLRRGLDETGDMVVLTAQTLVPAVSPPYPYGDRVRPAVPVRAAGVLVPDAALDRGLRLRGPGTAGGQRAQPAGRDRPAGRLLRARLDPGVRPVRDRRGDGRGGRHRDHRRPGRAQDPRGARRLLVHGRRPDQEPGRATLPGADDRDRAVRHLRAAVRDLRRRGWPRWSTTRRWARSSPRWATTPRPPTCGARW